jgi:hypothetical protein
MESSATTHKLCTFISDLHIKEASKYIFSQKSFRSSLALKPASSELHHDDHLTLNSKIHTRNRRGTHHHSRKTINVDGKLYQPVTLLNSILSLATGQPQANEASNEIFPVLKREAVETEDLLSCSLLSLTRSHNAKHIPPNFRLQYKC